MQLNEVRKELQFNNELVQLIETLKNIAASQYHQMEKNKRRFNEFMDAFSSFFSVVDLVDVDDPLVRVVSDVLGVVVVTSDSGFMGGLNQGVIRAALQSQGALPDDRVSYVVIGDKGAMTFADMERDFKAFPGVDQERIYERAQEVQDYVVEEVLSRRMGRVVVAYPKPLSFTAQTIEVVNLLPCAELFERGAAHETLSEPRRLAILAEARKVIVESSFADIVEYLSSVWVSSKLFEIFEDSKLAEFSARAMHLEDSFQKVQKEQKKIKHMFHKASHERIDKGMRESFSARSKQRRKARPAATGSA